MTDPADLIAALRIPMNVTLREGAPELDAYDEQRKAAADALEDRVARLCVSAQWAAFDKVLMWINTQETKLIAKGDLYDAVMEMRPDVYAIPTKEKDDE